MARPYWSGQIQISLVSFGVSFYVATESKSEIRFHQIHRGSGERVRHQKVSSTDESPVEKGDIVKGYEYRKGEYIQIEPSEIEQLRIPSKHTIEVQQFVNVDEIPAEFFEKPYFVMPQEESQHEAFAVVREALRESGKAALGKIAFGGREHVIAITAPDDKDQPGMMAYTLRYAEELRDATKYVGSEKKVKIDSEQLQLAEQLIKRKTAKFNPTIFKDEYEVALRELVEAKLEHKPIPKDEGPTKPRGKVINLMDALRSSLQGGEASTQKKPAASLKGKTAAKKGPMLVERKTRSHTAAKRKSA